MAKLILNGTEQVFDQDPAMRLLWAAAISRG